MRQSLLIILLIALFSPSVISAAPYVWPSEGYVGYRFGDTTNYVSPHTNSDGSVNNYFHNGIDVWSNTDGGWNGGQTNSSNPIYSVTTGTVAWVGGSGLIISNSDGKYSNYWHVRNLQVSAGSSVNSSTLLGYQDMAVAVHVHITISTTASDTGHIDPTSYFETNGYNLAVYGNNVMPWGTYVTRSGSTSGCSGTNMILSNVSISSGSSFNCGVSQQITVNNSVFMAGSEVRLFIN